MTEIVNEPWAEEWLEKYSKLSEQYTKWTSEYRKSDDPYSKARIMMTKYGHLMEGMVAALNIFGYTTTYDIENKREALIKKWW